MSLTACFPSARPAQQAGTTLITTLLMLTVILLLGTASAQLALQGEKSSRNDRDHQIAFQAAEAALIDAEMDIQQSPDPLRSRSHLFVAEILQDEAVLAEGECGAGIQNAWLGVCRQLRMESEAAWKRIDFLAAGNATTAIPYGHFTGRSFQTGIGTLPAALPRYIIEYMPYRGPGHSAEQVEYLYRITAVGFGVRETTRVALQSFYRKMPL
ncbi:MAG: PilX N-terminal domain-containing pilus assembly protein [Oxalicibacterium faecigallinarum]|uniref:pilus assembly PilX family protein n=1 Tax=Oxalicibacterium faecigallinarum TaxID=573741 RepID=UPI002808AE92|nr:PilX N-terminal domain-containing pilus assembly protein [Oxalicibacterium faecigallinarum]MDQ7969465.1 PilX N-terminal domain-containing pilus assembly protein [Oxalicibacterium faecigallinarum]